MEKENLSTNSRVHHGHNIERVRKNKNLERTALEQILQMTPEDIIALEKSKVVSDDVLQKLADGLGVSLKEFKETEEVAPSITIENNTYNASDNGTTNYVVNGNCDSNTTIHRDLSTATLIELLLQSEREKNEILKESNADLTRTWEAMKEAAEQREALVRKLLGYQDSTEE